MNSKGKTEFKLPKMGESITEGTILNWIVNEGENFQEGDVLVEVGTDKVDNEVPAPFSGILVETKYRANDIVKIGEVIAVLEEISVSEAKGNSSEEKIENQDTPTAKKPTKPSPPQPALKTAKTHL